MKVRLATYADREAWDDFVLNHPDGTAYHFFAWKDAIEEAYAFKGTYLLAENDSGICGILPLIDFSIPLVYRSLISLPYCDAGGALADEADVGRELLTHARSLVTQCYSKCCIRSIRPLPDAGINQTDKVRMLLDLPSSSSELLYSLNAKVRSQVKKPIRDGLTVKVGFSGLINDFYKVFAENMRALGSPVHSRLWIESIVSSYGDRARVGVVYTTDGAPSAAGIVLIHPSTMSIPWASSLRRYKRNNSNMLLYWTFLALAIEMDCRCFDFGRSSPGEGTYRFKQQWGAQPELLYWYEPFAVNTEKIGHSRQAAYSKTAPKRQFVASLWQKLPQASTDWLGPKVRKYISL